MNRFTDDFNAHSEALRKRDEAADRDDLNFAMTGVEVGRIRKHLPKSDINPATGKKRNRAAEAVQRTLDWLLLNDPAYARLHASALSGVRSASGKADDALDRALSMLEHEQDLMDELLASAAQLPDGTRVFRDKAGNIRREDGSLVDEELAATIEWRGDEPTYEAYRAQKERINNVHDAVNELRGIQSTLGDYQNELHVNDTPPTQDRLQTIEQDGRDLKKRIGEIDARVTQSKQIRSEQELEKPTEAFSADAPIGETLPTINLKTNR
ncbi:MAG: hypothetical protein AAFW60_11055 [Pseudomonadota bacterium]